MDNIGANIYKLIKNLFPICRSITGAGNRQTLSILQDYIPLNIYEVPTSTVVFDWEIPKEWNIRTAHIKNQSGETLVDFSNHNLHVVSYSVPIHKMMTYDELLPHLHTIPENPDWIPYRTSYYTPNWGFCITHNQLKQLTPSEHYEVYIDSDLSPGSLTYGEYYKPGTIRDEILIYTHICHPSLCNDNLSGVSLVTHLASYLSTINTHYSYRFVFAPGTIGSITWLSKNLSTYKNIKFGLVVALVGDSGPLTYKRSRAGDTMIDNILSYVLQHNYPDHKIIDFAPYGYDERQFCSPGVNLPVGRLTRSPNGSYPEYHTSADDLDFVHEDKLAQSFSVCVDAITIIENNRIYINQYPMGEPQLGKRKLYSNMGGFTNIAGFQEALLWILNLSDGKYSLLDIAIRSSINFKIIVQAADKLKEHGLIIEKEDLE